MVTQQGFNALLKLVEEPPPHLKFIFATTEPEKVLPTIRSRTHHYPFRLVPPSVLRELMQDILRQEGVAVEESVLPLVARAGPWQERAMTILKWALIFFLVSIVAGVLGFTGISAASADVARFLFYVFVVIFLVLLILGLTIFRV